MYILYVHIVIYKLALSKLFYIKTVTVYFYLFYILIYDLFENDSTLLKIIETINKISSYIEINVVLNAGRNKY